MLCLHLTCSNSTITNDFENAGDHCGVTDVF